MENSTTAPTNAEPDGVCAVHEQARAVATCASCGRAACLSCAIPVRMDVLCRACAARAVPGSPSVDEPRPEPVPRPHGRSVLLLVLAVAASAMPWDRFGILTGLLSAWRPGGGPLPVIAVVALWVGVVAAFLRWRRPRSETSTRLTGLYAAAATAAALVTVWRILRAPAYVSPSPAPFVVVGCAALATAVAVLDLRRRRRARP